ncbi:uncharacterized protein BDZ99DRAFT_463339 [Mytilinidion resinicola]|uniref:Uncharacterized protein n=1 Tax=Mytilinidion resinicola TaxID=574789 RepID=A0A6A6YL00_9PEZI|nr:uncharacterized protein BDZ99DRAFT_463339 [Mytilinidion resinicola]KAF2809552.1 hypothetical protein BDZ99DRAFT_463339 [Mytilinidion resinicola]
MARLWICSLVGWSDRLSSCFGVELGMATLTMPGMLTGLAICATERAANVSERHPY